MDLIDRLKQLSERITKLRAQVATEEATKNAFVLPFLQALGYDVFNPLEVTPEFTADIGTSHKVQIESLADIYNYAELLLGVVEGYDAARQEQLGL